MQQLPITTTKIIIKLNYNNNEQEVVFQSKQCFACLMLSFIFWYSYFSSAILWNTINDVFIINSASEDLCVFVILIMVMQNE